MFACREAFTEKQSAADHVSTCPYLMSAWYWCSSCSCPESFLDYEYRGRANAKALAFKFEFTHWISSKSRDLQSNLLLGIDQDHDRTSDSGKQSRLQATCLEDRGLTESDGLNIEYEVPSNQQICRFQSRIETDVQNQPDTGPSLQGRPMQVSLDIKELRKVAYAVSLEWISLLSRTANLQWLCYPYSADSFFSKGIDVWGDLFDGDPMSFNVTSVRTCEDIIALMHVACASVIMMHCREDAIDWDDFFQDMLQWRHMLHDETEVKHFLSIVAILSGVPTVASISTLSSSHFGDLFDDLRDGPVMKGYSLALDGGTLSMFIF